ncbi:kinase/pyrophosphorylase [Olsenella massiliensis]|uniref:kinase/pyrophosphorylase n=1 Tax=Olsenella massiliensis TaxID=1622075 RepID=UPI00071C88BC|nr:kinase/pyrophosphorylase [Olsenella massiliensis]
MAEELRERSGERAQDPVTVHVVSDSLGTTATALVKAAAVQFAVGTVSVSCLSHVSNVAQVEEYLSRFAPEGHGTALFHTILDPQLREEIRHTLEDRNISSVDLLGPTVGMISRLTGVDPLNIPGLVVDRDVDIVCHVDAREL